jgi:hypothetical protein
MRQAAAIAVALIAACTAADHGPISTVTVMNGGRINFLGLVKELSPSEVSAFAGHWENKQETTVDPNTLNGFDYMIDISGGKKPGRWQYKITGEATFLDPKKHTVYKISNVQGFNKLIGVGQ